MYTHINIYIYIYIFVEQLFLFISSLKSPNLAGEFHPFAAGDLPRGHALPATGGLAAEDGRPERSVSAPMARAGDGEELAVNCDWIGLEQHV